MYNISLTTVLQGDLMSSTTHIRLFLCELETEEEKFYLGDEEVVRVDVIGTVVYISRREKVITFQGICMLSLLQEVDAYDLTI